MPTRPAWREPSSTAGKYSPFEPLWVGFGTCGFVLLLLPELLTNPGGQIWGSTSADSLGLVWTLWHTAWSLAHGAGLGIHTSMVLFPSGAVLFPADPLEAVLLAPLTTRLGPLVLFNIIQVAHVGLAAGAMYLLIRTLWGRRLPALALIPALAFSCVLLCTTQNGNIDVGQFYLIPLAGWAALRSTRNNRRTHSLVAGVLLGLALVANIYVGVSAMAVALSMALLGLRENGGHELAWRRVLRSLWPMMALAALISVPVLGYSGLLLTHDSSVVEKGAETVHRMRLLEGAAFFSGFFAPGVQQVPDPRGGSTAFVNAWGTGWMLLLLACFRIRRSDALDRVLWWLVLSGLALSLGPVLRVTSGAMLVHGRHVPLPYVFLDQLPPFSMLIELWRFSVVVQVGLAALAARTLADVRPALAALAGAVMLAESLLVTPGRSVWKLESMPDEPVARLLQNLPAGAILSFPIRQGDWPLYYQTQHHRPVANSPMNAGDPAIFGLVAKGCWSLPQLREAALEVGYRWLMLHSRPAMLREQPVDRVLADLEAAGLVLRQEGSLALVDLDGPEPWPDVTYRSRGQGTRDDMGQCPSGP